MNTLYFQAKTITPLIIAGAENKMRDLSLVRAEGLRPPSLRGAMRWWFRAMMGSVVGAHDNYDYKTLHGLEGKIFGATDQGSSIRLRTYPLDGIQSEVAYLCMNDQTGKTWMGISRANIQRPSLSPPSEFRLNMQCDEKSLPIVLGSLWLLAMLGGVGARSRRGFGSLKVSPLDDETGRILQDLKLDFTYPEGSLGDIERTLEDHLKRIQDVFFQYASRESNIPPSSSLRVQHFVISQTRAKLWLIKPHDRFWTRWQEAMNDLRDSVYREYKRSRIVYLLGIDMREKEEDINDAIQALNSKRVPKVLIKEFRRRRVDLSQHSVEKRGANTWNLTMRELEFTVRVENTRMIVEGPLLEIGSARPRQASPLIIQIKRTAQDNYFGILLAFDEQFNKQKYLGANWSDFISFLSGLSGYEYREVTLP